MKRTLLVAGLSIAVLFGASVAIILALGRPPPTTATPDPSRPPSPVAIAPAPPTPPVAAAPFKGGKLYLRATPNGERQAETSMPMADRVTRKAVRKALQAASLQSRLARCVDRDREVGFGGGASPARIPRPKPATLILDVETLRGQVRIADARVQGWGGASQTAVSCAREVLRDKVLAAPAAKPGKHVQMPFPLNPRSQALAATR
jgi:hypothetical protein